MAGSPGSGAEISPPLHPNRKPALVPGTVPEHRVAAELELTIYRLRRDAARAPERWPPIFEQLAQRLFDPRLRVKTLRKAHRLARPAETHAFEKVFGCEPGEYVTRLRIDTVQALLPIESLTVWACAERAGFASPSGFEETYRRLCEETPTETRARLAAAGKTLAPEPPADPGQPFRRLLSLQETPEKSAAACRALREHGRAVLRERAESLESWERLLGEEWWEQVGGQPIAEQWPWLGGRLETTAAFETLCRASREEGRADRRRGLELAHLALGSLTLLYGRLEPSHLAELEIKGLAELGNAYRLVRDFSTAAQAFAAAEHRLEVRPAIPAELNADVLWLKASLYQDEYRIEEALVLTQRALALAGEARVLRAEILLLQGGLLFDSGQVSQAILVFKTGFELLSPATEPYLAWVAMQYLAIAYHKSGDDAAATGWLERAEPVVRSLGQPRLMCLRDWLVGLLAKNQGDHAQADLHLRRAHAGYEKLQDLAHAAVLSLDLAALYLRLERFAEAAQLVAEALPQLASLGLSSEGILGVGLLRQALQTEALSTAVLEKVRACVARMVGAPELAAGPER